MKNEIETSGLATSSYTKIYNYSCVGVSMCRLYGDFSIASFLSLFQKVVAPSHSERKTGDSQILFSPTITF